MKEKIKEFILRRFLIGESPENLTFGTPLLNSGIINSMGMLILVTFLRREFGVAIESDELIQENMGDIDRISAFVRRKQGLPPTGTS